MVCFGSLSLAALLSRTPHFVAGNLLQPDILRAMERRLRLRDEFAWMGVFDIAERVGRRYARGPIRSLTLEPGTGHDDRKDPSGSSRSALSMRRALRPAAFAAYSAASARCNTHSSVSPEAR